MHLVLNQFILCICSLFPYDIIMGHRQLHGIFWPDLSEHDQNFRYSNGVQRHLQFGSVVSESSRVAQPVENRLIDQGPMCPNWNHSTISNGYSNTHHNSGTQHHHPDAPPLHNPYLPLTVGGCLPAFPSNYVYPPSSNNDPSGFYGNGPSYEGLRVGGRGSLKRKNPAIPFVDERGNTSRYVSGGSSSSGHIYPNLMQEKPNFDSARHWEHHAVQTDSQVRDSRPIGVEGASRNVRRRYAFDVEPNFNGSGSYGQFPRPVIHPIGHSIPMESTHWMSSGVDSDWRRHHMPSVAPGVMPVGELNYSSQQSNLVLCGGTAANFSSEARGHRNYVHGSRNISGHQRSCDSLTRPAQVVHGYSQQWPQAYRNTYNASGVGPAHDNTNTRTENYSLDRDPRPFHREVFVPTDNNVRPSILHERCRFLPGDISGPDGPISEGFMVADQSAMQGFRNMFDQHSDMRLDVDNMSYEELLALGESIGNVCTGLSDDAVTKCLMEAVHGCSSDGVEEEEICAICLEAYKNMESVGSLRDCGHGYHSSCIKKWLSMKNSCPICKAPGLAAENFDDKE
uniref:RING-type E3 ubiquitin transferase n=1 Tax=Kalanchoe fedtschenkoi TaxID=63787 RepID=A0A7N0ZZS1_KALFE